MARTGTEVSSLAVKVTGKDTLIVADGTAGLYTFKVTVTSMAARLVLNTTVPANLMDTLPEQANENVVPGVFSTIPVLVNVMGLPCALTSVKEDEE